MTWQPRTLTRQQMEERRLTGGRLLRSGRVSKADIARRMGVSRATVSIWDKRLKAGGLKQLKRRLTTGRPAKLTLQQRRGLRQILKRGALAAGFPTDRWTLPRIRQVIQHEFQVTYHPKYLKRLMNQLGWTPQIPLAQAIERQDKVVKAWLKHDWPRIKKSSAAWPRNRVF